MSLPRFVARSLLASMFVAGGLDALRNAATKVRAAETVAPAVASRIPGLSDQDTETLVRLNGGVQLVGGTLLALGRAPRLSALALAASLVPTTAAGHRFWEHDDPAQRQQHQIHFLKNASMFGGLLLAALDTEGKPGLVWRTRHAAEHAEAAVHRRRRDVRHAAEHAAEHAEAAVRRTRREARLAAKAARTKLAA
jgi:putative oxidoreductase